MQNTFFRQIKTYKYKGAIHIHTKYSDGTGNVKSIAKAAKQAGLDWIIITDHNSFEIQEGFYNGVCVIKGEEISPKDSNHYLALGINEKISPSDSPQVNIDNVRKQGGFGFAAHPDEGLNSKGEKRKNKWKPLPWTDKNVIPDGIEIWNWFSNWGDGLVDSNIFSLAYSYFFKYNLISNPSSATMQWWDKLNNSLPAIVPAIGGVDAHAIKFYKYILPVTVFPYKTCFKTITNVITLYTELSEIFEVAKKQILDSIRQGNNIIVNRRICNDIPHVFMSNGATIADCGNIIELQDKNFLYISMKDTHDIKILKDGNVCMCIKERSCAIPVYEKGVYRVEFFDNNRGFAYTNPIKVI